MLENPAQLEQELKAVRELAALVELTLQQARGVAGGSGCSRAVLSVRFRMTGSELAKELGDVFFHLLSIARVLNVFHSENLIADRILAGVLELLYLLGEVQQEPETAQGAVEQMQQVLDQVRPGNCDDPAHDPSESEDVQSG